MPATQIDLNAAITKILGSFDPYCETGATSDSAIQSRLDSLALVGFLVDVERYLEENHSITLNLTDELLTAKGTPLATVRHFVLYLQERIKEI